MPTGNVRRRAQSARTRLIAIAGFAPIPRQEVYQLLEPGPVVLLTTSNEGRSNVMTMSWHTTVEFEPPRIACVVSRADYSFAALRSSGECVIAVPDVSLAQQVVDVGNCCGREVDKFALTGLTPLAAQDVDAPIVAKCFANLECRVIDTRLVPRYELFVLEVVRAWGRRARQAARTLHHRGNGVFVIDGEVIRLESGKR
jgi:flavin reductase (DIM6/NTAB) family NADH-FMN oxidoreductase RutF